MPHAIIRGNNGRRHEVDFGNAPILVEIFASGENVEIVVETDSTTLPEQLRSSQHSASPVQRSDRRSSATEQNQAIGLGHLSGSIAGLFNAQYMTRKPRIASIPPKAMR